MLKLFAFLSYVLHNYFDGPNKIVFRSVSKFSDISTEPFFPLGANSNEKINISDFG